MIDIVDEIFGPCDHDCENCSGCGSDYDDDENED